MRWTQNNMLASPELNVEAEPWSRVVAQLPLWRQMPLYRERLAAEIILPEDFSRLPFISKPELRENFPANFLGAEHNLFAQVEAGIIELEYTSGTSDERTPVMFRRGWWHPN